VLHVLAFKDTSGCSVHLAITNGYLQLNLDASFKECIHSLTKYVSNEALFQFFKWTWVCTDVFLAVSSNPHISFGHEWK